MNGISSKWLLLAPLDPLRLTQIRCFGAFVIIISFVLIRKPHELRVRRSALPLLIGFGVFGFAAVQALYFISISRLNVATGLIIEFTAPIWITLWLRFVKKESVAKSMWLGLTFGFGGLILVAQVWKGLKLDGIGLVAATLDAFALAAYFLFAAKLSKTMAGDVMIAWGLGITTIAFAIFKPWSSFPFHIFTDSIPLKGHFGSNHLPGFILVLWVVTMGTIIPYMCGISGIRRLSASTASVIGMLEPVLAGVFAWIALGETFNPIQLFGGLVVLVGIYFADRASTH